MKVISDHLYRKCVQRVEKKCTLSQCRLDSELFQSFDFARYATDVTFHQSSRPTGDFSGGKAYFPGKKCTGTRSKCPFLPSGMPTGCTAHYPECAGDLETIKENKAFYEKASKKGYSRFRLR